MAFQSTPLPSRPSCVPAAASPVAALRPGALELVIRPVVPSDRDAIERGFQELTPDSKYYRFHTPFRTLPEWLARYLTEVDGVDHVALIGFDRHAEPGQDAVGVARFVRNPKLPESADLAITIADRLHGRGLARCLLAALVRAARERGIRTFTMDVIRGNRKAHRFVLGIGAVAQSSAGAVVSFAVSLDQL
jgi:RimJ/RimL family protein N-acetyltransferase